MTSSLLPEMDATTRRPEPSRRLAALVSIVLLVAILVSVVVTITEDVARLLVQVPLLAVALAGAWYGLTRIGIRRIGGTVVAVAAIATFVVIALSQRTEIWLLSLLRLVGFVLAVALGRYALERDLRSLKRADTPGAAVPAAARGALIMNLKSGGGKAEKARLDEECRRRGIEPIVLTPGDDLLDLARDAIDRGADVIGMAGGDGSQALVATVAAERDIPMVVVPAGTRNHLALDLGLDRDDVVGALDAFGEAVERPMDLADVNGRVFVNNVSLGIYAAIVRSPEYRDAKADTTLATLPKVLGPGTAPFDLRFVGPKGEAHDGAHLIQVSNNPYGGGLDAMGSRPRLDTRLLGIVTLTVVGDRAAGEFMKAVAASHPERFGGFASWSSTTFEVSSDGPIDVGLDGESLSMDPPLSFSIRERQLRVRLPEHAIGYSPAARSMHVRDAVRALRRTAMGKATSVGA